MLRYAWQNAGYDIGEPVDNFTGVIDVAIGIDVIECAVVANDNLAFLHWAFCSHSFYWKSSLAFIAKMSAFCAASTMTVTSRERLHRFSEKGHSPAHSEVPNGL